MKKPIAIGAVVVVGLSLLIGANLLSSKPQTPEAIKESASASTAPAQAVPDSGKGMVTMLDLGATQCIPCKMMAPIVEELKKEYQGRAAIIFTDVWKNPDQARKYGIKAIPTQIFFDQDGKEVLRHTGFMDKKSIVAQLEKMGVK